VFPRKRVRFVATPVVVGFIPFSLMSRFQLLIRTVVLLTVPTSTLRGAVIGSLDCTLGISHEMAARSVTCGSATPESPHAVQARKLHYYYKKGPALAGPRPRAPVITSLVCYLQVFKDL